MFDKWRTLWFQNHKKPASRNLNPALSSTLLMICRWFITKPFVSITFFFQKTETTLTEKSTVAPWLVDVFPRSLAVLRWWPNGSWRNKKKGTYRKNGSLPRASSIGFSLLAIWLPLSYPYLVFSYKFREFSSLGPRRQLLTRSSCGWISSCKSNSEQTQHLVSRSTEPFSISASQYAGQQICISVSD